MKATIPIPTVIEIAYVHVKLPVRYEEEDIPNDFPLRKGDVWEAIIEIDTGKILDWPTDPRFQQCGFNMKVCDEGTYELLGPNRTVLAAITENYVPNALIPGEYGDYVEFDIDNGRITNWPKTPNVAKFFGKDED